MKILLLILLIIPGLSLAQSDLSVAMNNMSKALVELQGKDGRFEGTFEADPGLELLSLVLLKKYGHGETKIEEAFIQKAMKWKTIEGFGHFPQGPYSHDVTGLVLISLKALNRDTKSLGLTAIEQKFDRSGGIDSPNLGTKILLAPLGLISSKFIDSVLSVSILGIPESLPLGQKALGIFRSLIVPVTTWNYFRHEISGGLHLTMPGDRKRAIKGLEWILHRQMTDGSWYTVFHTLVNVAALSEAQKAGVGNFKPQIDRALKAIKRWRTKNWNGEITQQLTLTTGWDTPQTLIALSELPENIRSNYKAETKKAIAFLDANQITEKGDWSINTPDLVPGGWSFIVENRDYPDTDVVAAVLEGKLAFPDGSSFKKFDRGLTWLLGLQNKDGGFPAWEKGVSPVTDKIIKTVLPELPDYSDLSQADVTARITRLLHKIRPIFPEKDLDHVITKSCRFIKKSKEKKSPFWKGRWLVAYLYGTSESIDTLASVGCADVKELTPSLLWLLSQQKADGGFGESHSSFNEEKFVRMSSTVMQTSYVVHGLIAYEEIHQKEFGRSSAFRKHLDKAMSYLLMKARNDNWLIRERSFTGVIGAKLWYSDYALSPQFMTLRALGRCSRLFSSSQVRYGHGNL